MQINVAGFDQRAASMWKAYLDSQDWAGRHTHPDLKRTWQVIAKDALDAHFDEVDRRAREVWPETAIG
jgi:hypothetical protein